MLESLEHDWFYVIARKEGSDRFRFVKYRWQGCHIGLPPTQMKMSGYECYRDDVAHAIISLKERGYEAYAIPCSLDQNYIDLDQLLLQEEIPGLLKLMEQQPKK